MYSSNLSKAKDDTLHFFSNLLTRAIGFYFKGYSSMIHDIMGTNFKYNLPAQLPA